MATCYYCYAALTTHGKHRQTWDHKVPKSKGGRTVPENMVLSCFTCNQEKGVLSAEEYKLVLHYRETKQEEEPAHSKSQHPHWPRPPITTELTLEDYGFLYDVGVSF
jgi:5-methylcytosine-specific restriction endonuclease McrA